MSGNIVNFNTTNLNDGTPQVSILASASTKRMQERRRQSRLLKSAKGMGVGKKYPGVGTHHRNTKHVWLYSELAEVSAAYKEHHTTMPCWKIADMLYYSFGEQLKHYQQREIKIMEQQQQQQQQQQQAIDDDDNDDHHQPIAQLQEPRTHLPSIQAIQAKLMDCITLEHNDTFGYVSQPTQMHKQVWEHLALAEKHRNMLKQSFAKKQDQQYQQYQQDRQDQKPHWNVHAREFLFNTDADFEATLPPAKRRKVVFEDEEEESAPQQQQQQQQQKQIKQEYPVALAPASKADFDAGIAELVSLMGEADDARQKEKAILLKLVEQIREHNTQIEQLHGSMQCAQAEIKQHREAIARIIEQIASFSCESMVDETSDTPMTATAAPPAMVCNKCTKTIEGGLGGFSVSYADPSHPQHETIECEECMPLSPASRKFLEYKNAEYEAEYSEMGRAAIEEEYRGYAQDFDSDMDDYPGYYDHAEECS